MADFEPQFLFLCAVGRSGTTVLRRSLGLHEEIYYNGFENNSVQDLIRVALKNCTMPTRKKAMAVDQAEYDRLFRDLIRKLIWPANDNAHRPVYMAAINPDACQLPYLSQIFPGCKFVSLIRNGIEVVSSRSAYDSFASQRFETHCEVWNRSADVHQWAQQHPENCLLLRHEWFYQPQRLSQWMQELSDRLSIPYCSRPEEHMLGTLQHPTNTGVTIDRNRFAATTINDKQSYFHSKRDRWRSWTPQQRSLFDERCGDLMVQHGYELPWRGIDVVTDAA